MSKAPSDNQYFGTEKTMKILFKLAPPVMLAQLIQSLYNIVDSFQKNTVNSQDTH